jgi:polyhydroxybutyrate depolymerase
MALRASLLATVLLIAGCASHPATGLTTRRSTVAGIRRTWYEYRPKGLPSGRVPLVIVFHGYGARPLDMLTATGIEAEANRDGFIVAVPVGTGPMAAWNAGSCCGHPVGDDIGLVEELTSALITGGHVDPARVYAVGFSNGAMFAYRLGCQLADLFAGIAVVEGTMTADCPSHRPVDLLVIHQLGDQIVPFAGTKTPRPDLGVSAPFVSVPDALAKWESTENCQKPQLVSPVPAPTDPVQRAVSVCANGTRVEALVMRGGGHYWPPSGAAEITTFFGLRTGQ